jgi:hypothetical protein
MVVAIVVQTPYGHEKRTFPVRETVAAVGHNAPDAHSMLTGKLPAHDSRYVIRRVVHLLSLFKFHDRYSRSATVGVVVFCGGYVGNRTQVAANFLL